MRAFPGTWPVTDGKDDTLPDVYIHIVGSAWPPAHDDCLAGYATVDAWTINRDLVAALMPGQMATQSGLSVSRGTCVIAQSAGERMAPWKAGNRRVFPEGTIELIASYDGPTGSTAFLLGTFRLDPVSGKASESSVSLEFVEDWVSLRRPNTVHQVGEVYYNPESSPYDPARVVEQIAEDAGFAHDIPDFGTEITSIYFPGDRDALSCLQDIIASNLAAARVDADGQIVALTYEQLAGDGDVVETLDVLDKLVDLEWVIDPAESFDRVEVKFGTPQYRNYNEDVSDGGTNPLFRATAAWTALDQSWIAASGTRVFTFDPGCATGYDFEGLATVTGNTLATGLGTPVSLLRSYIQPSTGRAEITLQNPDAAKRYMVSGDGKPCYLLTGWKDASTPDAVRTLAWGADAYTAVNPLSVDLGKLIQREVDARMILDRIVSRAKRARWRINSVNVAPDLRREIGDIVWLEFTEDGLRTKVLVTSVNNSGVPGNFSQVLGLAVLGPIIRDHNDAWAPGSTIADWNAKWADGVKTYADYNASTEF